MSEVPDVSGCAALAMVESLLLALNDRAVLSEAETLGLLQDAAKAHENMPESLGDLGHHAAVSALINQIKMGMTSVRRT